MSSWGTNIQDNDTYADTEASFFTLLEVKKSIEYIFKVMIGENVLVEEVSAETHEWWFAILERMWFQPRRQHFKRTKILSL